MLYTRGPVTTDRMWNKPTKAAITAWAEDMSTVIDRSGYTAHIVGRSLTDIDQTQDVDIVYTGMLDPNRLEQLLITSLVVGFRHRILVDARWQNVLPTAEYKNNKVTVLPTEFVYLNYFEHDYGNGHKIINDFRLNPLYKKVNDNLVMSTFEQVGRVLKPYQLAYIVKHGTFACARLEDYIKE